MFLLDASSYATQFASPQWTAATCFLAFQTFLMVLTGLILITGKTDGLYKFEPHTEKTSSRQYEIALGGHLVYWGAGMTGALIAGGAQVMCILQLPPMLACTYYHYAAGGEPNVIVNCVIMVALACCGFMTMPVVQSIEWTPAAFFVTFQASLMVLIALMFILGKTEAYYESSPHMKEIMSRHGELQIGGVLLGMGAGLIGAVIAGGAQNMCILQLPPLIVCTYSHYAGGSKKDVITNSIFLAALVYLYFPDASSYAMHFASPQWTAATCFLAFQTFLMVLTGLMLITGNTDGLYKFEPHTEKISSRQYEIALGGGLVYWGNGMAGALIAGGAQVMCILQLPPMLACTYYHYAAGGKSNVIVNCVIMVALACCGFMTMPVVQSIEWTPVACFVTFQASLMVLFALMLLSGRTEAYYESSPHMKEIMSRHGELQTGGVLLGMGAGLIGAVIAGGAQDMCILQLPPLLVCTYSHYAGGSKRDVIVNSVFMVALVYLYFGIAL